jgi:hypothetical protein
MSLWCIFRANAKYLGRNANPHHLRGSIVRHGTELSNLKSNWALWKTGSLRYIFASCLRRNCANRCNANQTLCLHLPEWRNGRRAGFKILCPQGRVGSTPTSGTFPSGIEVVAARRSHICKIPIQSTVSLGFSHEPWAKLPRVARFFVLIQSTNHCLLASSSTV